MQTETHAIEAAKEAIDNLDDVCFLVADESGQNFADVKNNDWFVEAVANQMEIDNL